MQPKQGLVVVGFDGSPMAERALRFSLDLARTESRPLRVVVARGDLYRLSRWADDWSRGLADEWIQLARKVLADEDVDDVEMLVRDGLPSEVLVIESAGADCLVVGAVGHGAVLGRLQGSVSQHVSRQADCPVVVVREARGVDSRLVVVGVDGSPAGSEALEFAIRYAGIHDYQLDVLYCPEYGRPWAFTSPEAVVPELIAEFEAHDEKVLREVDDLAAKHPRVPVNVRRGMGSPANALVEASGEAALVVVGAQGRGAFHGLLLGSVSAEVLRRAHCPVAVVR